jgi:hypothetical protein
MSKIHTALKASAGTVHSSSAPRDKPAFSSLDEKLIAAGVAPEVIAEAHSMKGNNGSGFIDGLIRKKALDEIQLLKILAQHFGLSFWRNYRWRASILISHKMSPFNT